MPVPVFITPPGLVVTVQVPVDGNPFNITVPVFTVQVGCVIVPIIGAYGIVVFDVTLITAVLEQLEDASDTTHV